MSERRMFAKSIVTSDAFLDMPHSSRCLYFTLAMLADDDGFVNNPKSIMRQAGATPDDMNVLLTKKFVLAFDTGVIVIKHWRIHNYIRGDRKHDTNYKEELALLGIDEKGAYTMSDKCPSTDRQLTGNCHTEVRLGKDSIGKSSSIDLLEVLTDEEIARLKELYQDHYQLIDECQADANRKGKVIEKPFSYIVGYAENKGWLTK